jgi:hypothetical protein
VALVSAELKWGRATLSEQKGRHMDDEPADLDRIRPVAPRIKRRRQLSVMQHIPSELGVKFTQGEMCALKVIADEHVRHGACTLTNAAITDLASTSRTVVQNAIRTAVAEGLIEVRLNGHYNTITIISAKWKAWLDRYGDAAPDGPRQ